MGISIPALRQLLELQNFRALQGDILLLGRMSPMFTTRKFLRILRQHGFQSDIVISNKNYSDIFKHNPNDIEIFKAIGFKNVYSLDVSAYEGADFVLDLNKPLPEKFNKKFDFIYDGGTLEHVFDFPQALKNLHAMLNVGGFILHENPANNFVDHGFYQFSPSVYFDYYKQNHYEIIISRLCRVYRAKNRRYLGFNYLPNKFEKQSYGGWGNHLLCNFFVVKKLQVSTSGLIPNQSRYQEIFWQKENTQAEENLQDWRKKLQLRYPKTRYWYVRIRRAVTDYRKTILPINAPRHDIKL